MSTFVNYAEPVEIVDGLHVAAGEFSDPDIQTERIAVYVDNRAVFLTSEQTAELIAALAQSLCALFAYESPGGAA